MNDQQAENRQQIIAAEEIDSAVLLCEVTYQRGRIERLEAQLVTLEARLAATITNPGDSHEYSEPKPLDFNSILEWFDAQIEYHDGDESDGE